MACARKATDDMICLNNFWEKHQDRPFVIAEIGSNFDQNLDKAKELIDAAVHAKASAVKFQLFRAEHLYPDRGVYYDLFKSLELNPSWVPILSDYARKRKIFFLASAFDARSVDILEDVDVPIHKIASSEAVNLRLLRYIAEKKKPIVLSTGMCDMVDVEEAMAIFGENGEGSVVLMQCGARYPLPLRDANLDVLTTFRRRFNCLVGLSDHTEGLLAATVAVGKGARVFEKHLTLNRTNEGPDHFFAMEPTELTAYVENLHAAFSSLGSGQKSLLQSERDEGRRSGLFAARKLRCGEKVGPEDIVVRRPAIGLRARYKSSVIGASAKNTIEVDEPLSWEKLSFEDC